MSVKRRAARYGCLTAVSLCVGTCVGTCIVPAVQDRMLNTRLLAEMEESLRAIAHPDGTESVKVEKAVGLLIGCGNHRDFFVGELRTFSGNRDEIRAFYAGITIHNPVSDAAQAVEVAFVEPDGKLDGYLPDCYDRISGWDLSREQQGEPMYLVFIFSPCWPPTRDFCGT